MTGDPIFDAYTAVEMISAEIDRLVTAIPGAFAPKLGLTLETIEYHEDDWSDARRGYHFLVKGAVPRQRVPGQLLLAFDLYRPAEQSAWPHAQSALLTCAYAPRYQAEGWSIDHVLIGADGRLTSKETFDYCTQHAGGQLFGWTSQSTSWSRRAWLYTMPLLQIDGHDALQLQIVQPVLRLVLDGATPETALEGSIAIPFAS